LINCKQIDVPKLKIRPQNIVSLKRFFDEGSKLFEDRYLLNSWKSFNLVSNYKDSPILSKFDFIKVWKDKLQKEFEIESMYISILLPKSSIPWHVDMQTNEYYNKAILTAISVKKSFIEFENDSKYVYKKGYSYMIKSGTRHRILNLSDEIRIMICTNPKENKHV